MPPLTSSVSGPSQPSHAAPHATIMERLQSWATTFLWMLAWLCALIGLLPCADAAAVTVPGVKSVDLVVKTAAQGISIAVPAGCTSCVLEFRVRGTTRWVRWTAMNLSGKPNLVNVTPPKAYASAEWRATGTVSIEKAQAFAKKSSFPDRFYQGVRSFGKTPALGYELTSAASGLSVGVPVTGVVMSNVSDSRTSTATSGQSQTNQTVQTTESDIWKTDGNIIYFFNQLRGLQVLDISDPASPKLNALLRMPEVGQDMYLLPAPLDGGERLVVLLARDGFSAGTTVITVGVSGRRVREISRTSIPGGLSDSRMAGSRLYVATTDWSQVWSEGASGTALTEVAIHEDGTQTKGTVVALPGQSYASVISSGAGWLSVATTSWPNWNQSQITLFRLDETGASLLTPKPITVAGNVGDKFKVSFDEGVLSAVSLRYDAAHGYEPVSMLENFDVSGSLLGSLEIIRGEQLYATRYTGSKLYAVTFRRTDPLWIIDLSDRNSPVVSGHVEVPGYSTYIEPMGDAGEFLFTLGMDSGKVAASLFNVSDVTQPVLAGRVFIDEGQWGYSEAVYDEKALKVLPEEGLALVPFSANAWMGRLLGADQKSFLRLVEINLRNGGSLSLRGHLKHEFSPRRATLVNGVLASISQKELITADVSDRDNPVVLADVALAWPVDQVIQAGEYLLQISDGTSAVWSGDRAVVRISKASAENSILNEIDLGDGSVQEAVLRASKLYVLRKNWNPTLGMYPAVRFSSASGLIRTAPINAELALDIYDASSLPKLSRLGSVSLNTGESDAWCDISRLLWVTDTLAAVITQPRPVPYWRYPVVYASGGIVPVAASSVRTVSMPSPGGLSAQKSPQPAVVRPVDVGKPAAPVALRPFPLAGTVSTLISSSAAGDGLLVFGYGQSPAPWRPSKWPSNKELPQSCVHRLGVLDFANPRSPVLRAPVSLPGRLFALGQISRAGFLSFTESMTESIEAPGRQVQVSLIDDLQASLFATFPVGVNAAVTAEGRMFYVSDEGVLKRFSIADAGVFEQAGLNAVLPWSPTEMQVRGFSVLGTNGANLLRASWPGLDAAVESWQLRQSAPLSKLAVGADRSIYVPEGAYGVSIQTAK